MAATSMAMPESDGAVVRPDHLLEPVVAIVEVLS